MEIQPPTRLWFLFGLVSLLGCETSSPSVEIQDTAFDIAEPATWTQPQTSECPEGEIPDGDGCVPELCGSGTWGDLELDERTIFVNADTAAGGDGSQDRPFLQIQDGVNAAAGGGAVAVAAGTYIENLELRAEHDRVLITGRCAELVIIDGQQGGDSSFSDGAGISAAGESTWTVSGVSVRGAPVVGVYLESGQLTLESVRVESNPWYGALAMAGHLDLRDSLFDRNTGLGLGIAGDASATVTGSQVRETLPDSEGEGGYGVVVIDGGDLHAADTTIQGNHETGLLVILSSAVLENCAILDTQLSAADDEYGVGVNLQKWATLTATDTLFQGNHHTGITVGMSSVMHLERCEVSETQLDGVGDYGTGIDVQGGGELTAIDTIVRDNHSVGISVTEAAAVLERIEVRDTAMNEAGEFGYGIEVFDGSEAFITDSVIQGNHNIGVYAAGSELTLEGSAVLDTQVNGDSDSGYGVVADSGSTLWMTESTLQGSHTAGLLVSQSTAVIERSEVIDTRRGAVAESAFGVISQHFSTLTAEELSVRGTDGIGVFAGWSELSCSSCALIGNALAGAVSAEHATLELLDSSISDTEQWQGAGGVGVLATDQVGETSLRVSGSTIQGNPLAGIYLQGAGDYEFSENTIAGAGGVEVDSGFWAHGDGVFVTRGAESASTDGSFDGNAFQDNIGAAIFLDGGSASLDGNTYHGNGVDLVRQSCADVEAPSGLDDEPLTSVESCPSYDYLTQQIDFSIYYQEIEVKK